MICAHRIEYPSLVKLLDEGTERLVGETLTLLEAIMPEGTSRDAAKRMAKQSIWQFNRSVKAEVEKIMVSEEEK